MQNEKLLEGVITSLDRLTEAIQGQTFSLIIREIGLVTRVSAGIVGVSGLPGASFEELLHFPGGLYGIAYNIDVHEIGVILLGDHTRIEVGDQVLRTGRVMDVPVGEELIGRVIDPLGAPLDDLGPLNASQRLPIERKAPAIMDREQVNAPLQTGLKVVDALIPIGRGQRELILGDRQTGKTTIAIDTILNQKDKGVRCIYCAIGQRASSVAKLIAILRDNGALDYTLVVVAEGNDAPGLKYIAPYAATSIGEYFMEKGQDVLIVYDDLTNHARAYRELSLLLRRPPGREAFPGDIFYIHSRLLERSTHLNDAHGGGSLTALPIIETEAQNISAYIPTNLISITDGQLYLSPKLFEAGILPAVDVGKSVSRVGNKAQLPVYRRLTGNLKLAYAQFEELENYARFGTRLDAHTRKVMAHGFRIRNWLKQPELSPLSVPEQALVLVALVNHLFDDIPLERLQEAQQLLCRTGNALPADTMKIVFADQPLTPHDQKALLKIAEQALANFRTMIDKTPSDG